LDHTIAQTPTERNGVLSTPIATKYDPDACRGQWIAYIQTDFEDISTWVRDRLSSFRQAEGSISYGTATKTYTELTTITSWTTISKPTRCDGNPRVVVNSAGENISAVSKTELQDIIFNPNTSSSRVARFRDQAYDLPLPPFPACEITPLDCQTQWNLLQSAFSNWSTTFAEVFMDPLMLFPTCQETISHLDLPPEKDGCFGEEFANRTLDINAWMGLREYSSRRGFLSGCPQFEDMCLQGVGRYMYDRWWWPKRVYPDDPAKCVVQGDRFALIHFRPPRVMARDLCGNEGWGANIPLETNISATDMVTKTATLDSVVFPRRDMYSGKDSYRGSISRC
jgi:hypothetical protein